MAVRSKSIQKVIRWKSNPGLTLLGFVMLFAVVGVYLLIGSHASTPSVSLNADKGTLANGATIQSDSAASDGTYVVLGSAGGGGLGPCLSNLTPTAGLPFCLWGQQNPSAMNQPLPSNPAIDANSSSILSLINNSSHVASLSSFGTTVNDTASANTTVTLHCTYNASWGTCNYEGQSVRVNGSWMPSSGSDGAMVIIDRTARKVYDLWQVSTNTNGTISIASGTLTVGYGGVTSLDGNGQNKAATGSGLSHMFGMIRQFEMANAPSSPSTAIPHALHFASQSTCSTFRYPAIKSDGHTGSPCIPEGTRVFLDSSANCAAVTPVGSEAVCYALQKYGAYESDTAGSAFSIGLEGSGGSTIAQPYINAGFTADYYNMTNIPWSHLHVAADCQCQQT